MKTIKTLFNKAPANVEGATILHFFLISCVLVVLSDIPNNFGGAYIAAKSFLAFSLLSILFFPLRPAIIILILLAVAGQDNVSSLDAAYSFTQYSTSSIWQLQIGPLNASLIVLLLIFIKLIQEKTLLLPKQIKQVLLWFLTVPIATALLYGNFTTDYASTEIVVDIKFPLILLSTIILCYLLLCKSYKNSNIILSALVGGLLARHLADLLMLAANYGPAIAQGISRGSIDSAKGGVIFLIFFGTCLFLLQKRLLMAMIIAIPSVLLLIAYGTRMLWVTFALGIIVLLFFLETRKIFFFIVIILTLTGCGIGALSVVNPDAGAVILLRSQTITKGRAQDQFKVNVNYNIISRIDPARYAEFFNILDSLNTRLAFLWGSGYGGYYNDNVLPFPPDLSSAFPRYSFLTHKFYRAHGYPTHIILKYGLIGFFIISSLWITPWIKILKIYRNNNMFTNREQRMTNLVMLCVVAFVPTAMLQLYWSGKGLFINGLLIACCLKFVQLNISQTACSKNNSDPFLITNEQI